MYVLYCHAFVPLSTVGHEVNFISFRYLSPAPACSTYSSYRFPAASPRPLSRAFLSRYATPQQDNNSITTDRLSRQQRGIKRDKSGERRMKALLERNEIGERGLGFALVVQ